MKSPLLVAVVCAALASPSLATITLLGKASIPGTASDKSALPSTPGSTFQQDRLGSFGSGIAYTGIPNRYIAVDDRGPSDGNVAFRCRFQTFEVLVHPDTPTPVAVTLVSTTLLSSKDGQPFTGNSGAYDMHDQARGLRLDPEAVRVSNHSTLFISDEYGPWIDEFSLDGRQVRRFAPPARFMVTTPDGDPAHELPPSNTKGRQPNHGFEGLAITPDGSKLYAILQDPLIQDHALSDDRKRTGHNCRILELTLATGATRELVYPLEVPKRSVNELLAINDHEFLVLERDTKPGAEARARGLFKIDITDAADVTGIDSLPAEAMPKGAVHKKPFLDFTDPHFALAGADMPEKIEGIAWGQDLADGRHVLVVTTDNDLKDTEPSWFWVFAVDPADVPGFEAQHFSTQASPSSPSR